MYRVDFFQVIGGRAIQAGYCRNEVYIMPVVDWPTLGLWMGIASLVFGIIVMIFPKILNYLVGIYLIIIGIMAIVGYYR